MSRERRDAEAAARRARRLAERADERARRKERQADRAAERAERLAERTRQRPARERDLDRSIEDFVDEMTDKAERWIDEQTRSLFSSDAGVPEDSARPTDREAARAEREARRARDEAEKARSSARRAEKAADEMSSLHEGFDDGPDLDDPDGMGMSDAEMDANFGSSSGSGRRAERSARRRARRRSRRERLYGFDYEDWFDGSVRRARRRKTAHLYRDKQRKKIMGVCAGVADYFGRPTWEIRLYAVLGLFFIPSVTIPAYFITYFLMDDMPYYRRVTDRFDEGMGRSPPDAEHKPNGRSEASMNERQRPRQPQMNNVQTMKRAREKFADIEQRLRQMESHVTSSRFELQRELRKISGED